MKKRTRMSADPFGTSFMDVLANTIGGLAFLLVMAVLMAGAVVFSPPKITTERIPDAFHGVFYEQWLGAREGMGLFQWGFPENQGPAGLVLAAQDGKLSGTPQLTLADGAAKTVRFRVTCQTTASASGEAPQSDTREYTLVIRREKPLLATPLKITTPGALPDAYRGRPYPLAFSAEGGQPPYLWKSNPEALPQGLELTGQGHLQGKPEVVGRFTFPVEVQASGETRSASITLNVGEDYPPPPPGKPLRVLTGAIPAAVALRSYHIDLSAEGGTPPYQWEVADGGVHPWLQVERGGFGGTPNISHIGVVSTQWQVRDQDGQTAKSKVFPLEVLPPSGPEPAPLTLKTASLPRGRAQVAYQVPLAVEGGYPPYRWAASFTGGANLGIGFDEKSGVIQGLPPGAGEGRLTVRVTDRLDQTVVSPALNFVIEPKLLPLKILSRTAPRGRVGGAYDFSLAATGGFPPYTWELKGGALPAGVELAAAEGSLKGVPEKTGVYRFQIEVADSVGTRGAQPFDGEMEIFTTRDLRPIAILTRALPELRVGTRTEIALACTGGAEPYRWSAEGLPPGLGIEEGRLTGRAEAEGTFAVQLTARDAWGDQASQDLVIRSLHMTPWIWALIPMVLLLVAVLTIYILARVAGRWKPRPLTITTRAVPNARASASYELQLACEGGRPPFTWSLVSGQLPPGLELSPDGTLKGVPYEKVPVSMTQEVSFEVEVKDAAGRTDRIQL